MIPLNENKHSLVYVCMLLHIVGLYAEHKINETLNPCVIIK